MSDRGSRRSRLPIMIGGLLVLSAGGFVAWRVFVGPPPALPEKIGGIEQGLAEKIETLASKVNRRRGLREPRFTLGKVYESNKQYKLAARTYAQVLDTSGGDASVWYRYAYVVSWLGRIDEAIEAVDKSIALDDTRAYTHWRRALWLLDLGRLDEAEASIERALELDPSDVAPLFARVRLHLERGDAESALALIESEGLDEAGVGSESQHDLAGYGRSLRADALRRLGRFEDARAALTDSGDTKPSFHDPTTIDLMRYREGVMYEITRATQLMSRGAYEKASELLRSVLEKIPEGDYRVYNMLGVCEIRLGNRGEAMRLLEAAHEHADNYETNANIATAMLEHITSSRVLELTVLPYAEAALEHRPNSGRAHMIIGRVHMKLGDHARASEHFVRAHELDARSADAPELAGFSLLELGEYEKALRYFERALEIDPSRGDTYAGRARALAELGRFDEAEAALSLASGHRVENRGRYVSASRRVERLRRESGNGTNGEGSAR